VIFQERVENSMIDLRGILVVGEREDGHLASVTKELVGGAKRLAEILNQKVSLLLIGEETAALAQEGISSGADKVYTIGSPAYSGYHCDSYTHVVSTLCKKINPSLCLMGHTDWGREVAPRVAARLGAGLCMDCVEIRVDPGTNNFIQVRPVYGGKAMAEMASLAGQLQIDTVRQRSMAALVPQNERQGEIADLKNEIGPPAVKTKLIERKEQAGGVDLEKAKIIVAGGGGIGDRESFETIKVLAQHLGGAVGATRVPVDEGWVPHSLEIGQTGKMIAPDLYIAIGISGATQHITGILDSKYIVAVNKDPDANIFKVCNLGVLADYKELLPRLIEKLKSGSRV
jgi:electron transfer flavoprotein alpha subunit